MEYTTVRVRKSLSAKINKIADMIRPRPSKMAILEHALDEYSKKVQENHYTNHYTQS